MDIGTLLLLALVLACPLMMLWMMRGHGKTTGVGRAGERSRRADEPMSEERPTEGLERHEPPYTKSDGMVAPKFGAAGGGGAEHERTPERHDG